MQNGEKTLQEIYSQPEVWDRCLTALGEADLGTLTEGGDFRTHEWLFIGCGTSYYLAQAAAASLATLTGLPARALPASEVFSSTALTVRAGSIFPVLISRSGHTSEILQVGQLLKQRGIEFMAITCDGNELTELTPRILRLPVVEASTVMTSSFTSMLIALQYLIAQQEGRRDFLSALEALPAALSGLLPVYGPQIEQFTSRSFEDVSILGQGALYPIASESALKIMESSSSYAQYFHTLEFRHGPKSIVSERVLVGALLSDASYEEESAVLLEMKELGAQTFVIANRLTPAVRSSADLAIELGLTVPELARLVIYVVWGQLLGCHFGIRKGLNPDAPRHLSRVVTLTA